MIRHITHIRFAFVLASGFVFAQSALGAVATTQSPDQPPAPPAEMDRPRERPQAGQNAPRGEQLRRRLAQPPVADQAPEAAPKPTPDAVQGDRGERRRAPKADAAPRERGGKAADGKGGKRAQRLHAAKKLRQHMAKRGGGIQMKVRGLREGLGSLRINYDGALRAASRAEVEGEDDEN